MRRASRVAFGSQVNQRACCSHPSISEGAKSRQASINLLSRDRAPPIMKSVSSFARFRCCIRDASKVLPPYLYHLTFYVITTGRQSNATFTPHRFLACTSPIQSPHRSHTRCAEQQQYISGKQNTKTPPRLHRQRRRRTESVAMANKEPHTNTEHPPKHNGQQTQDTILPIHHIAVDYRRQNPRYRRRHHHHHLLNTTCVPPFHI